MTIPTERPDLDFDARLGITANVVIALVLMIGTAISTAISLWVRWL